MDTQTTVIALAQARGSAATTRAGAWRYLLNQVREVQPVRLPGAGVADTAGYHDRGWRAALEYRAARDEQRAARIAAGLGAWRRDVADALTSSLTPLPDPAPWPYRTAQSRWAGGEHTTSLALGAPGVQCDRVRVWSHNGKWSGSNTRAMVTVTARAVQMVPSLLARGPDQRERVVLDVDPATSRATWVEQSAGTGVYPVEGVLLDGVLYRRRSVAAARTEIARRADPAVQSERRAAGARLAEHGAYHRAPAPGYKVVARLDDGRLVSLYDGKTEYRAGETLRELAKPHHGGGYYYSKSPGEAWLHASQVSAAPEVRDSERVLLQIVAAGRRQRYGNHDVEGVKLAASTLRVLGVLGEPELGDLYGGDPARGFAGGYLR